MHEFSIAMNIVDIATEYAEKDNTSVVKEIEIEVGELAGVVMDALEFSLELAVKETILDGARRNIISVPGKGRCTNCSHVFEIHDLYTICPECSSPAPEIIQGRELRVKSLVVE